jgi:hypothetical protein
VPTKKAKYQEQVAEKGKNVAHRVSSGYVSVVDYFGQENRRQVICRTR